MQDLIKDYEIEMVASPHSKDERDVDMHIHVEADLRDVLPYLNAVLKGAMYAPERPALTWRYQDRSIGFWPDHIAVADAPLREESERLAGELVGLVNDVWSRREAIEPDHRRPSFRQPIEIYRELPGTNCQACGVTTCFNFALKLSLGLAELDACKPLFEEGDYAEPLERLKKMLADKRPAG